MFSEEYSKGTYHGGCGWARRDEGPDVTDALWQRTTRNGFPFLDARTTYGRLSVRIPQAVPASTPRIICTFSASPLNRSRTRCASTFDSSCSKGPNHKPRLCLPPPDTRMRQYHGITSINTSGEQAVLWRNALQTQVIQGWLCDRMPTSRCSK